MAAGDGERETSKAREAHRRPPPAVGMHTRLPTPDARP